MIDFVFTVDYEIYGNGTGSLRELVYEPGAKLQQIFLDHGARFVAFVEVAELEKIEAQGSDPAIDLVRQQVLGFHQSGFEIALHIHPQWTNARYVAGEWVLDFSEYNLCTLTQERIKEIANGSIEYLRYLVNSRDFTPLSFRAGNWLFQPTSRAAEVLRSKGVKLDSSLFKGGLQRHHGLDYRPALTNGDYWRFRNDVNCPDATGQWVEVPIYSAMVLPWRMATLKRQRFSNSLGAAGRSIKGKLTRFADFMRLRYPLKMDFCRMTLRELISMTETIIHHDNKSPDSYHPVVTIGHTKDLVDYKTVESFLQYLSERGIVVQTFEDIYPKLVKSLSIESLQLRSHSGRHKLAEVAASR